MLGEDVVVSVNNFDEIGDFSCNKIMLEVLLLLKDNKPISEIRNALKLEDNILEDALKSFEEQGVLKVFGLEDNKDSEKDVILWRGSVVPAGEKAKVEPKSEAIDTDVFLGFTIARLSKALGPIAEVVVEDEILDMGENRGSFHMERAAELINILARQIPREDRKIEFQKAMMDKLKVLAGK